MMLQQYYELFFGQVEEVLEEVGAAIADNGLAQSIAAGSGRVDDDDWASACEQALAIRFI
jgi:hypothetical protein